MAIVHSQSLSDGARMNHNVMMYASPALPGMLARGLDPRSPVVPLRLVLGKQTHRLSRARHNLRVQRARPTTVTPAGLGTAPGGSGLRPAGAQPLDTALRQVRGHATTGRAAFGDGIVRPQGGWRRAWQYNGKRCAQQGRIGSTVSANSPCEASSMLTTGFSTLATVRSSISPRPSTSPPSSSLPSGRATRRMSLKSTTRLQGPARAVPSCAYTSLANQCLLCGR
jgi:hypothetical protein